MGTDGGNGLGGNRALVCAGRGRVLAQVGAAVGQGGIWGSGKCRELPMELGAAALGRAAALGELVLVWQDAGRMQSNVQAPGLIPRTEGLQVQGSEQQLKGVRGVSAHLSR